jgi:hypothetical protein
MNVSFNSVSQCAHVGWGYIFVTAPAMIFHAHYWWFALAVVLGAGVKEYADAHGLETPDVAGNSWEDWAFWIIGVALALAVLIFSGQVKI